MRFYGKGNQSVETRELMNVVADLYRAMTHEVESRQKIELELLSALERIQKLEETQHAGGSNGASRFPTIKGVNGDGDGVYAVRGNLRPDASPRAAAGMGGEGYASEAMDELRQLVSNTQEIQAAHAKELRGQNNRINDLYAQIRDEMQRDMESQREAMNDVRRQYKIFGDYMEDMESQVKKLASEPHGGSAALVIRSGGGKRGVSDERKDSGDEEDEKFTLKNRGHRCRLVAQQLESVKEDLSKEIQARKSLQRAFKIEIEEKIKIIVTDIQSLQVDMNSRSKMYRIEPRRFNKVENEIKALQNKLQGVDTESLYEIKNTHKGIEDKIYLIEGGFKRMKTHFEEQREEIKKVYQLKGNPRPAAPSNNDDVAEELAKFQVEQAKQFRISQEKKFSAFQDKMQKQNQQYLIQRSKQDQNAKDMIEEQNKQTEELNNVIIDLQKQITNINVWMSTQNTYKIPVKARPEEKAVEADGAGKGGLKMSDEDLEEIRQNREDINHLQQLLAGHRRKSMTENSYLLNPKKESTLSQPLMKEVDENHKSINSLSMQLDTIKDQLYTIRANQKKFDDEVESVEKKYVIFANQSKRDDDSINDQIDYRVGGLRDEMMEIVQDLRLNRDVDAEGFWSNERKEVLTYLIGPGKEKKTLLLKDAQGRNAPILMSHVNQLFDQGKAGRDTLFYIKAMATPGAEKKFNSVEDLAKAISDDANAFESSRRKVYSIVVNPKRKRKRKADFVERLFAETNCGNRLLYHLNNLNDMGLEVDKMADDELIEAIKTEDRIYLITKPKVQKYLLGPGKSLFKDNGKGFDGGDDSITGMNDKDLENLILKTGATLSTESYLNSFNNDRLAFDGAEELVGALGEAHEHNVKDTLDFINDPLACRLFNNAPSAVDRDKKYVIKMVRKSGAGADASVWTEALDKNGFNFDGMEELTEGIGEQIAATQDRDDAYYFIKNNSKGDKALWKGENAITRDDMDDIFDKVKGGTYTIKIMKKLKDEGRSFESMDDFVESCEDEMVPDEQTKKQVFAYLRSPTSKLFGQVPDSKKPTMEDVDEHWTNAYTIKDLEELDRNGEQFNTMGELGKRLKKKKRIIRVIKKTTMTTVTTTTTGPDGHESTTVDQYTYDDLGDHVQNTVEDALEEFIAFQIRAFDIRQDALMGTCDPYVEILRKRNHIWERISKSEVLVNTKNPKWDPILIRKDALCMGDPNRNIMVQVWDNNFHGQWQGAQLIGQFLCTLNDMTSNENKRFALVNPEKRKVKRTGKWYDNSGHCSFVNVELVVNSSRAITSIEQPRVWMDDAETDFLVKMQMSCSNLTNMSRNKYIIANPFVEVLGLSKGEFVSLHKTETVDRTLNPTFLPFVMLASQICSGEFTRPIRIKVWDQRKAGPLLFGVVDTTLRDVLMNVNQDLYIVPDKDTDNLEKELHLSEGDHGSVVFKSAAAFSRLKDLNSKTNEALADASHPLHGIKYVGKARLAAYCYWLYHGQSVQELLGDFDPEASDLSDSGEVNDAAKAALELATKVRKERVQKQKSERKKDADKKLQKVQADNFQKKKLDQKFNKTLSFSIKTDFPEGRDGKFFELLRHRNKQWERVWTSGMCSKKKPMLGPFAMKLRSLASDPTDLIKPSEIILRCWNFDRSRGGDTEFVGEVKLSLALLLKSNGQTLELVHEAAMLADPMSYEHSGRITFVDLKY